MSWELEAPPQLSTEVFEARRDAVLAEMQASNIELAIFTTPENLRYLTGVQIGGTYTNQALVLNSSGAHGYVFRGIERHWVEGSGQPTWCTHWRPYNDDQDPVSVVITTARELSPNIRRLGLEVERRSLPSLDADRIQAELDANETVPVASLVESLRVRKTPEELAIIRYCGNITRAGLEATTQAIESSASDAEAAAEAFRVMCQLGSEPLCGGPSVSVGASTARAHAKWEGKTPKPGEVVAVMLGASVQRYQCPIERTFIMEDAPPRYQAALDACAEAAEAVIDQIRPGMTSHQADKIARDLIADAGFGEFFINRLAYSFGIAFAPIWWENDIMQLRPNDHREVELNMVFHLVPALHIPEMGFMQRSQPIVVTADGGVPLIDYPLAVGPLHASRAKS